METKHGVNICAQKVVPHGADKDTKKAAIVAYQQQIFVAKKKAVSISPATFGMSEMRLIMEGELHVIAIKMPDITEGKSLSQATKELQEMTAEELKQKSTEESNFEIGAKAGDMLFLPSGFIFLLYSGNGCVGMRHGVSPPHDDEDARVTATVAAAINTYAGLKTGNWALWHSFLTSATA